MLFDSDWRDWLSQWDANGATTGNRPTGFPNRPTITEEPAGTPGTAGAPDPRYASTTAGPLLSLDDALAAIPASTTASTKSSKGSQNPQSRKAPNTRKNPRHPKKQQEPKIPATRSGTPEHIKNASSTREHSSPPHSSSPSG